MLSVRRRLNCCRQILHMADTLVVVYTSIFAHNHCRDENCLAEVGLYWQSINVILYLKYLMMEQNSGKN